MENKGKSGVQRAGRQRGFAGVGEMGGMGGGDLRLQVVEVA